MANHGPVLLLGFVYAAVASGLAIGLARGNQPSGTQCPSGDVVANTDGTCPSGYVADPSSAGCCMPSAGQQPTTLTLDTGGSVVFVAGATIDWTGSCTAPDGSAAPGTVEVTLYNAAGNRVRAYKSTIYASGDYLGHFTAPGTPGTYTLTAAYAGTSANAPASVSFPITVT